MQVACFGRLLAGEPDIIAGYRQSDSPIADPDIPDPGGYRCYPVLDRSASPDDCVLGKVLMLTAAELAQADEYEGPEYRRVRVRTRAGRSAWVYIRA